MKNALFLSGLLAITLSGFYGCRRSSDITPAYTPVQAGQALADLRTAPQTFTIAAGTTTTITGAQGTMLQFGPNSFTLGGTVVSSGTIEVQLVEVYKFGDMISQRASTVMYNGALLTTGGQVYVSATSNGRELQSGGYGIGFSQPAPDSNSMMLFIGNRNSADSVVRWSDNFGGGIRGTDSATNPYYQFYGVMQFGWINCDRFANTPGPKTSVSAYVPDNNLNAYNTSVWLIFPDIRSATYLGQFAADERSFQLGTSYQVPIGMRFYMVLAGNKNNTWYYDRKDGFVTRDMMVTMTPNTTTKDDIRDKLSKL